MVARTQSPDPTSSPIASISLFPMQDGTAPATPACIMQRTQHTPRARGAGKEPT